MFSSSSNRGNKINPDGSVSVYCWRCRDFIGKAFMTSNRAICEMCRRIENGEPITTEALKRYEEQKLGRGNNTSLLVLEETPLAKEFSIRSLTGEFIRAIGLKLKPRPDNKVSHTVSKTKRRGSLFENPQFGSMQSVDEELKKQSETR